MRRIFSRRPPKPNLFWTISGSLLVVQLVGLIFYSWYLYRRFDLLEDFAHNVQAWYLISHGDLFPLDTIRIPSTLFLRDHFDLVMWPLSLLHVFSGSPFWLLVVQDVAVVVAELITLRWVWSLLSSQLDRHRTVAGLLAVVVLMANAWWYETVSFDVHMTPLGLPLLVLVGYSLTSGRWTRAGLAAAGCVLFGAVVTELLLFVGLGGLIVLIARRQRNRRGIIAALVISVAAGLWVLVVTGVGANQASNLASQYSYLVADNGHAGTLALLSGAARHPVRVSENALIPGPRHGSPPHHFGNGGGPVPRRAVGFGGSARPRRSGHEPVFQQRQRLVPDPGGGAVRLGGRRHGPFVVGPLGKARPSGPQAVTPSGRRRIHYGALVWGLACLLTLTAVVQDSRLLVHLRRTWWNVTPSGALALHRALLRRPLRLRSSLEQCRGPLLAT